MRLQQRRVSKWGRIYVEIFVGEFGAESEDLQSAELLIFLVLFGFFFFDGLVFEILLAWFSIMPGLGSVILVLFFDEFLFKGAIVLFLVLLVVLAILVVVALELLARGELLRLGFLHRWRQYLVDPAGLCLLSVFFDQIIQRNISHCEYIIELNKPSINKVESQEIYHLKFKVII